MNAIDYKKYIVSDFNGFSSFHGVTGKHLPPSPKKWNMRNLYMSQNPLDNVWYIGFLGDCLNDHYSHKYYDRRMLTPFQRSYYIWSGKIIQVTEDEKNHYRSQFYKYWCCQSMHWRPFWGSLTKKHATLMNELRQYWLNRWFNCEKPKIIKKLHLYTMLNSDTINLIAKFLPYPYQSKML